MILIPVIDENESTYRDIAISQYVCQSAFVDDEEQLASAAELFRTLSNASRLRVLRVLGRGPLTVGELAGATRLSQPMTSQHLRLLRLAGLVSATRTGRSVVYALADHHVGHVLEDALTHVAESHPQQEPTIRR